MHFRRANVMCSSSSPFPGYIFLIVSSIKINCCHIYVLFVCLFWLHITTLFGASRDKIVDSLLLSVIDNKSDLYLNLIWFVVFSATFNNISVISWRSVLMMEETGGSTRRKPPTCGKSVTNFITWCCIELPISWVGFELTRLVVIGTDCIGNCKSNYHTITITTPPSLLKFSCVYIA
jgi:hypothetical protein